MRYVALLRGINVGGRQSVAMADLRKLLTGEGFKDVVSLLQSGNLVFTASPRSASKLELSLEQGTLKQLKLKINWVIRDSRQWKK